MVSSVPFSKSSWSLMRVLTRGVCCSSLVSFESDVEELSCLAWLESSVIFEEADVVVSLGSGFSEPADDSSLLASEE